MKKIDDVKLTIDSTIRDALTIIDKGARRIALVVDTDQKLLGTITDGDIRRAILNNLSLDDCIEKIVFKTPTVCSVQDSNEKILQTAVEKKVYQVPIVDQSGKLVDLKEIDELIRPVKKENHVVLMVGGLGTRLRPLTHTTPKPMLKVGSKPILETILLNFKKYGFVNITLCVSYKSEIIETYFQDGSKFGVNIDYVYETKKMGTAGALSLLKTKIDQPFFVMNGDILTNINFESMMEYHKNNGCAATMGAREYDFQVPYGVIDIKEDVIKGIIEKPIHRFFINAGIYILDPCTLDEVPYDTYFDMPILFEQLIQKKQKCLTFPIHEYWMDIGRRNDYEQANEEYYDILKELE